METKPEFTKEYKDKLDWIMQESSSPKIKEIIAKLYGLPQHTGEALLEAVQSGVFSK